MRDFMVELNARLRRIETDLHLYKITDMSSIQAIHASSYAFSGVGPFLAGTTQNTTDLRGVNGVSPNAVGVYGMVLGQAAGAGGIIRICAGDETADAYSSYILCTTAAPYNGMFMSKLGVDGDLKLSFVTQNFSNVYVSIIGWYK